MQERLVRGELADLGHKGTSRESGYSSIQDASIQYLKDLTMLEMPPFGK